MIPIDGDFILSVAPKFSGAKAEAQRQIISAISGVIGSILDAYEINTRLRIAHFLAQIMHESAGMRTTEEFASGSAYESRADLGNTHKGDGVRYKGRGLLQLTGRANYKKYGKLLLLPLEEHPEIAAQPVVSLKIACEYWKSRNINAHADNDNLIAVTKLVNGGLNGLEDRRQYLNKAKTQLAKIESIMIAAAQEGSLVVLHRGSFGDSVRELQELLVAQGIRGVAIDGDFGPATEIAIKMFQAHKGLLADGIVGKKTWNALRA